MILPLADALMNCLQNLTSRIAGVDNEQMTNRVMGMGAMLGFGLGAIKEQFNVPSMTSGNGTNNNNSNGGFKGLVSRAKSVISPSMNLSESTDSYGNVNPIRDVLPKEKVKTSTTPTNIENKVNTQAENGYKEKSIVSKVASAGLTATKTYLSMGAKMAEGNFNNYQYNNKKHNRKNAFKNTEYINKAMHNNFKKNLGDKNEPKK